MKRRKFIQKPIPVEAIQFDGTNGWEVSNMLYGEGNEVSWKVHFDMMVIAGDLIIQKGMFVVNTNGGVVLMQEDTFFKNNMEV